MVKKSHIGEVEQQKNKTSTPNIKKPFDEPKLTFVEPRLTKHGDATRITQQGFFGTFVP